MRRVLIAIVACLLIVGASLGLLVPGCSAQSQWAGTWKVTLLAPDADVTLWLLRVEDIDGKPQATLLASGMPNLKASKLDHFEAADRSIHFRIRANDSAFAVAAYGPVADANPIKLVGSLEIGGQRRLVQLEQTQAKQLSPNETITRKPTHEAMVKAMSTKGAREQRAALRLVHDRFTDQPVGYYAALELVRHSVRQGVSEAEARSDAEQVLRLASPYGRELELDATFQLARHLISSDKLAAVGLDFLRKAEKMLIPSDSVGTRVGVARAMVAALDRTDKKKAAQAAEERLRKVEESLVEITPFKAPKNGDKPVVLVELFTGAMCPPCIAADFAFDAALRTYRPDDVVFLQYHVHVPGPDPLTNPDTEQRSAYYAIDGTPAIFVNGHSVDGVGGFLPQAQDRYDLLRKSVEPKLKSAAAAKLKLKATRRGSRIEMEADVTGLKSMSETVRLRFALLEDLVRYPGPNGQRFHHHVVRALPGGVAGFPLTGSSGAERATVELDQLRQSLTTYLTEADKQRKFPSADRPLDLKRLKVIAWVQDDKSKEVIQAAQADVP